MNQTVCDRCNRIPGGYASVSWRIESNFPLMGIHKDLCKDCFKKIFPEWVTNER